MRRHIALGGTVLLLALGAAVGLPLRASAHALLQASDPAEGAALDTPPAAVTITFGEEPDPRLSTITVVDTSGQSFTAGSIQTVPGAPDQLRVALRHLPTGVYTVTWKTVSTVDGHFAAGAYTFGVGTVPGAVPASVAAGVGSPPPSALAVAGRWVLYAGLVVHLGAAVVVSVIVPEAPVAVLVLLAAGWALSAAGTALVA